MRLYPVYIALLLIFIVLQLIYGKGSFADVNLEEYDMSKVEIIDSPFWCSLTSEAVSHTHLTLPTILRV